MSQQGLDSCHTVAHGIELRGGQVSDGMEAKGFNPGSKAELLHELGAVLVGFSVMFRIKIVARCENF